MAMMHPHAPPHVGTPTLISPPVSHLSPVHAVKPNPGVGPGAQRAQLGLQMARQRQLAGALRGGLTGTSPPAGATPGTVGPHGLPMIK